MAARRSTKKSSNGAESAKREVTGLTKQARKAIDEAMSLAETMYRIDLNKKPLPDVHAQIAAEVERAKGGQMKIQDVSLLGSVLGVVWSEAICREFGWEWAMVHGVAAIVSPTRSHVVFPVTYFCNFVARGRGEEPQELYGRLKAGSLAPAEAGAMKEVS